MKDAIKEVVGKTVKGVIVTEGEKGPHSQVFLVFSDNTYYELYTSNSMTISGAGGIDKGGMQAARAYASLFPNNIVLEFEDKI
jgi:hypothetical protein